MTKNLTILRKARGWSQAELARRANLNAGTVNLIESGRFRPYASQLQKLAAALDLAEQKPKWLLQGARPSPIATSEHPVDWTP